jgi:DNA-directed RNA polymerase subunit RPC12/RpoP
MLTYYCPNCWAIVSEDQQTCPNCGYILDKFKEFTFEDKLLAALRHSVPERRIMAAQILGNRRSQWSIPEFRKIIESDEGDYFFLRAVLLAVSKINHPDRELILQKASRHQSELVRNLANEIIHHLQQNDQTDRWDQHTG